MKHFSIISDNRFNVNKCGLMFYVSKPQKNGRFIHKHSALNNKS